MHRTLVLASLPLLAACSAESPSLTLLGDTCPELIASGDVDATDAQATGLERLNCHRLAAGLSLAGFRPGLNAGAQSHADYLDATGEYGHRQGQPDHPLYSGDDATARAAFGGLAIDPSTHALSEVVAMQGDGADPVAAVDHWLHSVYHRTPLLAPELVGVGFGSSGSYDVMTMLWPWSSDDLQLALWPADGALEVPTSFDSDRETPDPAADLAVVGYPVTLGLTAPDAGTGTNPHGVVVDEAGTWMEGPGGRIAVRILQPRDDATLLRTVALLPEEPLDAGATYRVRVVAQAGEHLIDEQWSFETAE